MAAQGYKSFASNTTFEFVSPTNDVICEWTALTTGTLTFSLYHAELAAYRAVESYITTDAHSRVFSFGRGNKVELTLAAETVFPIVFTYKSFANTLGA